MTGYRWWGWPLILTALAVAGCNEAQSGWAEGNSGRSAHGSTASAGEVFKVISVYKSFPFMSFGGDPNPGGFRFNLFLVSRKTGKGILASGVLQARMYRRARLPDGGVERVEACSWTQDLSQVPHTTREYSFGWGYQPQLSWGDAEVAGEEVEVSVWYEPPTGAPVYAQSRTLQVPASR